MASVYYTKNRKKKQVNQPRVKVVVYNIGTVQIPPFKRCSYSKQKRQFFCYNCGSLVHKIRKCPVR
jgi:hypothetical protein